MTEEDVPSDKIAIPAILLPPKDGSAVVRARVSNTNWKGWMGILLAVVVAPNLTAVASSIPDGAPFVVFLIVAVAMPLVAVVAGIRMAFDIRGGAASSTRLAVGAIAIGMAMTVFMVASLVLLSIAAN